MHKSYFKLFTLSVSILFLFEIISLQFPVGDVYDTDDYFFTIDSEDKFFKNASVPLLLPQKLDILPNTFCWDNAPTCLLFFLPFSYQEHSARSPPAIGHTLKTNLS